MSELAVNGELLKQINLLDSSPTFAIQIGADGLGRVSQPKEIAAKSGTWCVSGTTTLPGGTSIESVFEVNTDSLDTIARAYWKTPKGWCDTSDRARLLEWMARGPGALFPCKFETSIPLGKGLSSH